VYLKAVTNLVRLASLPTAFMTLDVEIKMTSRRVNALEYVLIPRIEMIIKYINQEMDEQTREEFFRVKKVVQKKWQRMEREKLLQDALAAAAAIDAPSLIGGKKDDGIMFWAACLMQ
jgi:V-type H+-transporting ATPase subunit D